jgi:hypothetical protein
MPRPKDIIQEVVPVSDEVSTKIRLEAVRLYVLHGTYTAVSRALLIPVAELTKWSRTVWWQDEVTLLRREEAAILDAKLTKLHGHTIEALLDRVENGERVWSAKLGAEVRAPMKSTDIAKVAHIVFTERQLLRNEPTAIAGDTGKVQVLADKLRALGAKDLAIIEMGDEDAEEAPTSSLQ